MSIKKLISSYAAYNLSANQQFVKWLNNQSEEQLQKDVPSSFNGVHLQHLFNHGTYHRGQIVTIAHNLGFTEMPSTDFLLYSLMTSNK